MKKISLFILIASFLASCQVCDEKHAAELNKQKALARGENTDDKKEKEEEVKEEVTVEAFDINKFDISKAVIGTGIFPFLKMPDGFLFAKDESKDSKDIEKGKFLAFPTQNDVIKVEGGSSFYAKLVKDKKFEGEAVDPSKSFEEAILKAGGVKVFEGNLEGDHKKKYDELCSYCGDEGIDTSKPVVSYVIRRQAGEGNVYFVMQKDGDKGAVQVLQEKVINPEDEVVTAEDIAHDLMDSGKSILHINFDTGNSHIKPLGEEAVNKISKVLKDNPDLKIDIKGYTDSIGDPTKNKQLSLDRANAVKDLLIKAGIDGSRLDTHGMGDAEPIGDNTTAYGQAMNRRVELVKQ